MEPDWNGLCEPAQLRAQDHGHDVTNHHRQEINGANHRQSGACERFQMKEVTIAASKIANNLEHKNDQQNLYWQEQPIGQEAGVPLLEGRQKVDFINAN